MSILRRRKDGDGYSFCTAPEELVGKGRCCHIHEEGEMDFEVEQVQRGMYEVKVNDSKLTIKAQKESIINFFDSLPKLDEEKQKKILDFLRGDM